MGLPVTLLTCVNEMCSGANLALSLCPLLTQGQIEALEHHAADARQGASTCRSSSPATGPAR